MKPSAEQDGPFRPLYVESDEVKIRYQLTEDEVYDAIVQWLENQHEIPNLGSSDLVCITAEKNGAGGNTVSLLDKYDLCIDVETK